MKPQKLERTTTRPRPRRLFLRYRGRVFLQTATSALIWILENEIVPLVGAALILYALYVIADLLALLTLHNRNICSIRDEVAASSKFIAWTIADRHASGHRGRTAQRPMHAHEIVMRVVKRHRRIEVRQLLAERVRQPRERRHSILTLRFCRST